jgi:hypothetical protein
MPQQRESMYETADEEDAQMPYDGYGTTIEPDQSTHNCYFHLNDSDIDTDTLETDRQYQLKFVAYGGVIYLYARARDEIDTRVPESLTVTFDSEDPTLEVSRYLLKQLRIEHTPVLFDGSGESLTGAFLRHSLHNDEPETADGEWAMVTESSKEVELPKSAIPEHVGDSVHWWVDVWADTLYLICETDSTTAPAQAGEKTVYHTEDSIKFRIPDTLAHAIGIDGELRKWSQDGSRIITVGNE